MPLVAGGNPYQTFNQLMWTDAVYVRDLKRLQLLPADKLIRMAMLLHEEYASYDLTHYILGVADCKFPGGTLQDAYKKAITASGICETLEGK